MGGGNGGGGSSSGKEKKEEHKYKYVKDAKDLLDQIGEDIYKIANDAALKYENELHGHLSKATFSNGERVHGDNPCKLNYQFDTYVTTTVIQPCKHKSGKRLSEVHNGECDKKKIKDSEKDSEGACAPFRRLHICDKNLEQIKPHTITATHNLLVDVCMAAQFEGASIKGYHPQYDEQYPGSVSTMCTMLARSFADIGDIIRGKDLYIGNKKERARLEENLKKIFKKIHDDVTTTNGKNVEALKTRYEHDDPDYYQLREDWWALNRKEVWKAITCEAGNDSQYFRHTCGDEKKPSLTPNKCRCVIGDVPTFFDYVPQYLRWFEEWAEDFCRKRKKKIENAIDKCREQVKDGKKLYCDLNGYNCEETARGKNKFAPDSNCNKCSVACKPFTNWIDNQKQEFDKQKEKYNEEIKKALNPNGRTTTAYGQTTINNLYVKDFYEKLREDYGKVETFLEKLSREGICQSAPHVEKETADAANFTKGNVDKTFSHTEYCRACPWCGLEQQEDGKWKRLEDMNKCAKEIEKTYNEEDTTTIPILTPDTTKRNIVEKYRNFCNSSDGNNGGQIKNWQCHYEGLNNNNCILGKWEDFKGNEDVKSYDVFFYNSIIEMLNDSIEWKKNLKICINNKSQTCKELCHDKCKCYKNWIKQKKKELDGIKDHFGKQKDIEDPTQRDITLRGILNYTFLNDIKEAYAKPEQVTKIQELLGMKFNDELDLFKKEIIIEEFLKEEQQKADECLKTHENPCPPQQPPPAGEDSVARSLQPADTAGRSNTASDAEVAEEEEEEEEDEEEDGHQEEKAEVKESQEPDKGPQAEDTTEKVCKIVDKELTTPGNLKQACSLKYGPGGKEKFPNWKCIPSGSDNTTTGKSGDATTTTSSDSGSICVPPRRRRLYVTPLTKWASDETTKAGSQETSGTSSPSEGKTASDSSDQTTSQSEAQTASQDPSEKLRDAFIESAAVETFFLWHKYKAENTKKPDATLGGGAQLQQPPVVDDDNNPQKKLEGGEIPNDFLRLMFYTLGDYRDILFSGDKDKKNGYNDIITGDKEIQKRESKIKETIDKVFSNNDSSSAPRGTSLPNSVTSPQNSDKRTALWGDFAQYIWNGMICALTYTEKSVSGGEGKTSITQDPNLKTALLDTEGKKPKKDNYQYKTAKLDENSGTEDPKSTGSLGTSGEKTTLVDFISRPPYFRYLEEWGQNFCKERKKRLDQIYRECKVDQDNAKNGKKCSGYGEDCKTIFSKKYDTITSLECRTCGEECTKYKKWIEKKKTEYEKQKSAYEQQQKKCKEESNGAAPNNGGNTFCGTVQRWPNAAAFLQNLGPCKVQNGKGKQIFQDERETFQHAKDCNPCSEFKVKCEGNGNCKRDTENKCPNNKITAENIKTSTADIGMLVSDNTESGFNGLDECKDAHIFKGIKKDEWKCGNVCGYVVCKTEKVDGKANSEKQFITIRALLTHWIKYFLEDYNSIRKKLNLCTKNDKESSCINGCKDKCSCVEKWISTKKEEWRKIKELYLQQYENNEQPDYPVKTVLEGLITEISAANDKGNYDSLDNLKASIGCNCPENSTSEDSKKNDVIDCMLKKLKNLKKKIGECTSQPSDGTPQTPCQKSTPPDEEDLLLEEENPENKVAYPKICGKMDAQREQQDEGDECKPASTDSNETGEKEKKAKAEEESSGPAAPTELPVKPPPPSAPAVPPSTPNHQPLPSDNTSDILKTTIPFGIALALTSIAFLFLK
ncbi:hypothetical protein PFMC_05304, partial [Plasmodium falciparum CAMP/Malaysia]